MNDQPEVDWVESRHRPAPSSDTPSGDDLPPIGPDGVPTNCSPETCATTPSRHCCLNDYDERLTCDQCGATETDAAPFAVRGGVAGYFDYCSRACEVAHGRDTPSGERANAADDVTWACKIGPASRGDLPSGSDAPMRAAVESAFRKLTGHDPEWTFSGWAHDLTEAERAVVEDRLPRPRVIAAAAREQMERAEAVIGTDLDPEAPERGWEIHEPDDALKITASDDTTHSSDTPSDDRVQMIEVRPGETRPMLDGLYDVTLPASGRPGLTLREAAIEAILIREQDTAFSVVARHIAALFTSLDAIPSTCPTATCHGCPDPEACEAIRPTPVPEASGRPPVHLLLDIWQALGGDSEAFHPWWAADPSFPDRWSQIVAAVAGNISGLAADANPPAGALLDIAIQFGAADRGEPTP